MNKRQIKKRVKRAKINKERGLILSLEDRHYIRNYGKRYYTQKEMAYVLINWDEIAATVNAIVDGVRNALADSFQMFADALRTGGTRRMREIKFKAYWHESKLMTSVDTIEFLKDGTRVSDGCMHTGWLGKDCELLQ